MQHIRRKTSAFLAESNQCDFAGPYSGQESSGESLLDPRNRAFQNDSKQPFLVEAP
jgi:hypothetical protein